MKREEYDNLLKELVTPETSVDRGLEIVKALQDDKDKSLSDYDDLMSKTNELQDKYKKLQATKVDDFFNKGTEFEPPKTDPQNDNQELPQNEEPIPSYDDIVADMIGE